MKIENYEDVADEQKSVESNEIAASVSDEDDEAVDEQVVITIGEEEPVQQGSDAEKTPDWVKELRKTNREDKRRIRELEAKLIAAKPVEPESVQLAKKPKPEDFDFDLDAYDSAVDLWYEQKRKYDVEQEKKQESANNQQQEWQSKLDGYSKAKADLRVDDFEDAEEVAQQLFSVTQQGIVLQGADNPALVIYAIGKNNAKAKELANIKDPVKFAFAVAKLEKELKVTTTKKPPQPERTVSGTGRVSGSVDSTLERLREEAARTGDMSKVMAYKRQKKI